MLIINKNKRILLELLGLPGPLEMGACFAPELTYVELASDFQFLIYYIYIYI